MKVLLHGCLWFAITLASSSAAPQIRWTRVEANSGQIVVESFDPDWADAYRESAIQIRQKLATPLGLGESAKSRTGLQIRVEPLKETVKQPSPPPRLSARNREDRVDLQITVRVVSGAKPEVDENFKRFFTLALILERTMQPIPVDVRVQTLPGIPLWLVEGLTQVLQEERHRDWALLVRRAIFNKRAPQLSEVLAWEELSDEKLQRAWQQAFCFYTWRAVMISTEQREKFLGWLDSLGQTDSTRKNPFWSANRDNILWKLALEETAQHEAETVFSWEETAVQFAQLQTLLLRGDTDADSRLVRLDQLAPFVQRPELIQAVKLKERDLLSLELRAHYSWRPVLARYRLSLMEIIPAIQESNQPNPTPKPGARLLFPARVNRAKEALEFYQKGIAQAQSELEKLLQSREKISDYLDWFEVTRPPVADTNPFLDYLKLNQELEAVDLRKNDPFKSGMLRVEPTP